MGQSESAPHTRRVDPRWARVTLEQLRDEEFLSKQLRRQETIAGARQAARASGAARGQSAPTGLFVDDAGNKQRRDRALWMRLLKAKDVSPEEEEAEGERGTSQLMTLEQQARQNERRDDQLMNAIVLLAKMPHATRTAYLLCHVQDLLTRYCVIPDPVVELVTLRRSIQRDMYEAVLLQHQSLRNASTVVEAMTKNIKERRTSSCTRELSIPPSNAEVEASMATAFVVELIGSLVDTPADTLIQKRELLREIATLVESLPAMSLAPPRQGSLSSSTPSTLRKLLKRLQSFLLSVACSDRHGGSTDGKAARGDTPFDVHDRTIAVTCLVRLAAAVGSVQDFLTVVTVLLGVDTLHPATADSTVELQPVSSPRAMRSSRQLVPSTPPRLKDPALVMELEAAADNGEERLDVADELANNYAVEQRLKQVHKQRIDVVNRGEMDGQPTVVDQLLASNLKRKTGGKSNAASHTKAAIVNAVGGSNTVTVHRASIPSVSPTYSLTAKNHDKNDDFNNVFSFGNASPPPPSARRSPVKAIACPSFLSLLVGPTLQEMDRIKPPEPPRLRHHQQQQSVDIHTSGEDREVWSCGQNSYGELGHGDTATRKSFTRIEALQQKEIVQVSAGNEHTIVLGADGVAYTCGYNDNGQCGHGVTTRIVHLSPLPKMDSPIAQVHAYNGCEHTVVVTRDGHAASCGYNYRGQLGHGTTQSETVPKLLRSLDGRQVRLVSCSYYHTVLTCDAGQVYTFGRNDYGQLGLGDVVDRKTPQLAESLVDHPVVSVACGQYHTMVVTTSGRLLAFGKNDYGQLGVDTVENQLTPVHIKAIASCVEVRCGYYHSMVLTGGAHVYGFGRNDYGQLGLGKAGATTAANTQLQQQRYASPQLVEDLEGREIVRLACGCYHTVAVSDNGILYVFGRNNHGQLGTGDTTERLYPYPIDDFVGKRIAMVAAGFYHTLVLTGGAEEDGNVGEDGVKEAGNAGTGRSREDASAAGSILASATARELFQTKSTAIGEQLRQPGSTARLVDLTAMEESDPSRDDDSRSEDLGDSSPTEGDDGRASYRREGGASSPTAVASKPMSNSVDVAVLLLAELDRLSKPFQPKRGVIIHSTHLSTPSEDTPLLLHLPTAEGDEEEGDLIDVEGCFEPFAIHVSHTTVSSLARLLDQLHARPFSDLAASPLANAAVPTARHKILHGEGAASPLQRYCLGVCLNLLNAHVSQVLRSGAVDLVAAYQLASPDSLLSIAVSDVRRVLLRIITSKSSADVAVEALESLMLGLDVFFPCQCARLRLIRRVVEQQAEDSTLPRCPACRSLDLTLLPSKDLAVQQLLLPALLTRLAEDAAIIRFLPANQDDRPSLAALLQFATAVVNRLNDASLLSMGELLHIDDPSASPAPPEVVASIALLHSIQKHLAAWASATTQWALPAIDVLPLAELVTLTVSRTWRISAEDNSASFPLSWRGLVEYALLAGSSSCDLLLQLLSRSQPSPTAARYRSSDPFEDPNFLERLATALEQSIVGQLLPSLVGCLLTFAHIPAFAVALLPSYTTLLKLLDDWNGSSEALRREAETAVVERLGKSLATSSSSSSTRQKQTARRGLSLTSRATAKEAGSVPVGDALALPWSLLLEKEVAMLCGELASTLARGDPVIAMDEGAATSWDDSRLFKGGLSAGLLHAVVATSRYDCTVPHSPIASDRELSFSLVLPPGQYQEDDGDNPLPSASRLRRLLSAMGNTASTDEWTLPARRLCDWLRQSHAKTDAAYRMLLRQQSTTETELEDAFFAALLHHSSDGGLLAAAVATQREKDTTAMLPRSLRQLWRVVAELRRRLVAKRTTIKNSAVTPPDTALATLHRSTLERCQLLQLVALDAEEEHRACLGDGGFVASYDPAYVWGACLAIDRRQATSSIRRHLPARYSADGLPFLAAFPSSRWRRVRTLFHVVTRWRAAVSSTTLPSFATEALEFVAAELTQVGSIGQFAYRVLIDPSRRLSLATRGYEALCDLVRLPSLDYVRVALLQQVASVLSVRTGPHRPLSTAHVAYRELHRNAQNDFILAVMQTLVDTAATSDWVLLVLLRCLSLVHLTEEQLAFVNDTGIATVLLRLLAPSSQQADARNDSIRALAVRAGPDMQAAATVSSAVWSVLRFLVLHTASSTTQLPLFPSAPDIFDALSQVGGEQLATPKTSAVLGIGASTSSTIRRSFEIIVTARRFAPLAKGLSFTYAEMLAPSGGPLLAMSPLVKPTEFSITTWIYLSPTPSARPPSISHSSDAGTEDKRVVFVRGDQRDLAPYLVLVHDAVDQLWQLEVGVATQQPGARVAWERLAAKDPVPQGKWTHVAIVLEGSKLRLYVNGVLDNQRSLAAPLVQALSASVDLDFAFGRQRRVLLPSSSSYSSAAADFLATLLHSGDVPSSPRTLHSFDGLLSHFRFHNRALSPIHVRIVFDEKKPGHGEGESGGGEEGVRGELATQRLLELHALVRVLVESDEGRAHLRDVAWTQQLWQLFLSTDSETLQVSSLRLLRLLLPIQSPLAVAGALVVARGGGDGAQTGGASFISHVLVLIGACVSPSSGRPAELRLPSFGSSPTQPLAIATELGECLDHVYRSGGEAWCQAVAQAIEAALEATTSAEPSLSLLGVLYVLGGPAELLRTGSSVQIVGSSEPATLISMEDGPPKREGKPTDAVFIAVDVSAVEGEGREAKPWRARVYEQCEAYRREMASSQLQKQQRQHPLQETAASAFLRIHRDDVRSPTSTAAWLSKLPAGPVLQALERWLVLQRVAAVGEEKEEEEEEAFAFLSRGQATSLVIKTLLEAAGTKATETVAERGELVKFLLAKAMENDRSSKFWTLKEVERRLWMVRTRVHQVLRDLEDHAAVEVAQWMQARRQRKEVKGAAVPVEELEETKAEGEEEDDDDGGEAKSTSTKPSLSLQLELAVDESEPAVEPSSLCSSASPDPRESLSVGGAGGGEAEDDDHDDDGSVNEDEDDDDDEEDEEEEDEDEAEAEEHRQEFVDELMVMGFPEEWCVLALKQTENDIVSASAWIVDNLEYLSRLQTTLDKQRDAQSTDKLGGMVEDEDDQDAVSSSATAGEEGRSTVPAASRVPSTAPGSPLRADGSPLISGDKETGRKLFGEMYFPFQEGGWDSNAKDRFFSTWMAADAVSQGTAAGGGTTPSPPENSGEDGQPGGGATQGGTAHASESMEQFQLQVESLEVDALLDSLTELEHAYQVLASRRVLVALLSTAGSIAPASSQDLFLLLKLVLFRGQQLQEPAPATLTVRIAEALTTLANESPSTELLLLDAAMSELETAAASTAHEAMLWTQRELARCDAAVLQEPAVELAAWLVDLLLRGVPIASLLPTAEAAAHLLTRLRTVLRSSNLALKFLALTTTAVALRRLAAASPPFQVDALLDASGLDMDTLLHAARHRFLRERVQHRAVFSLYLQAYVALLHQLRSLHALPVPALAASSLPPPMAVTCGLPPPSTEVHRPLLAFDRQKCRSKLLSLSEDGRTATYSGHEMWKAVVATQGFSTGRHEWRLRVDKTASAYLFIGVATRRANLDAFLGADDQSWGFIGDKALYYQRNRLRVYGEAFGEGDTVGVHLDCEQGTLAFSKNGELLGVAFDNLLDPVFPAVAFYSRHQQVSIIAPPSPPGEGEEGGVGKEEEGEEGTVEEAVVVCEMMEGLAMKTTPWRPDLVAAAWKMTQQWLQGSGRHVATRAGIALWVDTTAAALKRFGFQADERVRTPRGNGRVLGVADGRLWVQVDSEPGVWHMDPSRLRTLALSIKPAGGGDESSTTAPLPPPEDESSPPTSLDEAAFARCVHDKRWSPALDRALIALVNSHCEATSSSPWNVTPAQLLQLLQSSKPPVQELEPFAPLDLVARVALLRFFNAYLRRVIGFFDLTWQYFRPDRGLSPTRLLSALRGSVFTCIKSELLSSLMDKTAVLVAKADDDYDYPDDLTVLTINRPKAATAKCHPGTTKSLLLSMVGQAFQELHFLPVRTLRMVYSHPMDDGQLRSFKVKFEGEGVDDYGGPYREFFSQFFAELQMICSPESRSSDSSSSAQQPPQPEAASDTATGTSFLPFLLPSPNWRNGVGSNREKFIVNGSLTGATHVGSARVVASNTVSVATISHRASYAENDQVKRQLHSEMCHFLGQMMGICLRTRVCVRLDLAISVWKQLVGEDDDELETEADFDSALAALKEIDYVAYSLLKTLRGLADEYSRVASDRARQAEIEDELAAMDLCFTTYLSDGRLVELCANGSDTVVTMASVQQYIASVLRARSSESKEVVNVIKQGIHSIMPVAALSLLTWDELEKRVCGVAEVDVELLKLNTEYDEDLSATDEGVQRFWRVLGAMEDEDKRAFLRFVWARSRLPVGTAQFIQKFKIQSLAASSSSGEASGGGQASSYADSTLPKSHTCFFALQLPRYSSDDVCRKQLLYAIHNCVEMDGDFRLADAEMTGWTDVNPNDQLRF